MTAFSSSSSPSSSGSSLSLTNDCNLHCLALVKGAQARLFKLIESKLGQGALDVLKSADLGIPRGRGKVLKGRDGKVISTANSSKASPFGGGDNGHAVKAASELKSEKALIPSAQPSSRDSPPPDDKVDPKATKADSSANVVPKAVVNPLDYRNKNSTLRNLSVAVADAAGVTAAASKPSHALPEVKKSTGRDDAEDIVGGDGKKSALPVDTKAKGKEETDDKVDDDHDDDGVDDDDEDDEEDEDDDEDDGVDDDAKIGLNKYTEAAAAKRAVAKAQQDSILDGGAPRKQKQRNDKGKDGIDARLPSMAKPGRHRRRRDEEEDFVG